jgi:hypothetical protein
LLRAFQFIHFSHKDISNLKNLALTRRRCQKVHPCIHPWNDVQIHHDKRPPCGRAARALVLSIPSIHPLPRLSTSSSVVVVQKLRATDVYTSRSSYNVVRHAKKESGRRVYARRQSHTTVQVLSHFCGQASSLPQAPTIEQKISPLGQSP